MDTAPHVLEFRAFDMGIFAVETRHPFVVREAHGRKLVLQAARERRLTDAEIAVQEVWGASGAQGSILAGPRSPYLCGPLSRHCHPKLPSVSRRPRRVFWYLLGG
jgi:hypothetical protein